MWGTFIFVSSWILFPGFIPTHVGNFFILFNRSFFYPVHPHACGELFLIIVVTESPYGSSPRMWGTCPLGIHPASTNRFIPTHVGNLFLFVLLLWRFPVHPHACGELGKLTGMMIYLLGSSPRMWGTYLKIITLSINNYRNLQYLPIPSLSYQRTSKKL